MRVTPAVAAGTVTAPASKSYTHRALVGGYLARRTTRLRAPLDSADTRRTAEGLRALGAEVRLQPGVWTVRPPRGLADRRRSTVRCGSSGTTLRFLVALAGLRGGTVRFTGTKELRRRPIGPLLDALALAGVSSARAGAGASLPLEVTGMLRPGPLTVDASASSQFVSAILLVLPTLGRRSFLRVRGAEVSTAYIRATIAFQSRRGVVVRPVAGGYAVPGAQSYGGGVVRIPGDASSSAYLWAAGAVTGGRVCVRGIDPALPQADMAVLDVLRDAGAEVRHHRDAVQVGGRLSRPIAVDLDTAPDLLPLLAAVAAVTPGRHRISGAAHAQWKESDRRQGSAHLARLLGARTDLTARWLRITGVERPRSLRHLGWTDHRLVMSAAVGALAVRRSSTIGAAESVRKSYPAFWRDLRSLGVPCGRVA